MVRLGCITLGNESEISVSSLVVSPTFFKDRNIFERDGLHLGLDPRTRSSNPNQGLFLCHFVLALTLLVGRMRLIHYK